MDLKLKVCTVDQKGIDREKGIIPFILTERIVDRDSEVIEPNGGRLDNYIKNPVFLWAHDLGHPPIGRVIPESLKANKQRLMGDVQFDLGDPFAKLIFDKYDKGFLNAGSIRFIPLTVGKEPVIEGQRGATIQEWELLEFSAVPVPANQGALAQKDFKAGLTDVDRGKAWLEELKSFMEDDTFDHTPEGWVEKLELDGIQDQIDEANKDSADFKDLVSACELEIGNPDHVRILGELVMLHGLTEPDEAWDGQKPYPNEHACRVKDPGQYVRIRRQKRNHEGKDYYALIGFKSGGGSEDQAYRYPKDIWTEAAARSHCKSHDGEVFEPAKKEDKTITICGVKANGVELPLLVEEGYQLPEGWSIEPAADNINYLYNYIDGKAGRVLSAKNRSLVKSAVEALTKLLEADEKPEEPKQIKLAPIDEKYEYDAEKTYAEMPFAVNEVAPHHNEAGEVVWDGVAKSMIELLNGEYGLTDEETKSAYKHLAEHYQQFKKEPPELLLIHEDAELSDDFIKDASSQIIENVLRHIMEEESND